MLKRLKRDRPNVRTCLTGAVVLAMLLSPLSTAHAKDNILASAYGFIEVYLTETKRAEVHGKVVYRTP